MAHSKERNDQRRKVDEEAERDLEWRYNLFRHKWQPDLCCAVPEDYPVPGFITGEQWEFAGTLQGAQFTRNSTPIRTEANLGMRANGYRLFQVIQPFERPAGFGFPAIWGLERVAARASKSQ